MSEANHVSGMTVGPLLDQETHDAILETRERRKQVGQEATKKRSSRRSESSDKKQDTSKSEG